jgi:hypothetical protein
LNLKPESRGKGLKSRRGRATGGAEATKLATGTRTPGFDTLAAVLALVARSQIVVAKTPRQGATKSPALPAGFDDVDIAILEWIAAEGRRLGRGLARL